MCRMREQFQSFGTAVNGGCFAAHICALIVNGIAAAVSFLFILPVLDGRVCVRVLARGATE